MLNCAICLSCNAFLWSQDRHDFVGCGCENHTFIDGGNDYQRSGGADMGKIAYLSDGLTFRTKTTMVLSREESIKLLANHVTWGSYGKDGKGPKVVRVINDLDTDHIKAILRTQPQLSTEYTAIFNWVLKSRGMSKALIFEKADQWWHKLGLETLMTMEQHREWFIKNKV